MEVGRGVKFRRYSEGRVNRICSQIRWGGGERKRGVKASSRLFLT